MRRRGRRRAAPEAGVQLQREPEDHVASPVRGGDRELEHGGAQLAATLNDMLDRLERSFAETQRFTADAAHELRTPLAVIRSEAEVALRPCVPATSTVGGWRTCSKKPFA